MQAAILALRQQAPARIVVAVPVGARETCERMGRIADEVVCVSMPEPFNAVGLWYEEFSQTTDEDVKWLLSLGAPSTGVDPNTVSRKADAASVVRDRARPLKGDPAQYDALLEGIGDARVVLIGEATHGTHEFYRERAFITRRLIAEKGFAAVAVEADWPDAYRINRYVRGTSADEEAVQALTDFGRFPTWMWRNADVLDFIGWLRTHNDTQPADKRAGFYGLDLYSLRASMEAVLGYLDKVDPEGARRARRRYGCFDQFGEEMQDTGTPRVLVCILRANARSSRNSSICTVSAPSTRAATAVWQPTSSSTPSKTRAWSGTRKSITAPCSGAVPTRGTFAIATWWTPFRSSCAFSTARSRVRASSCGRTTPISATPGPPR